MQNYRLPFLIILLINIPIHYSSYCGCKVLRACYKNMLDVLRDHDEAYCIEDSAIGASTTTVFLKALEQYCPTIVTLIEEHLTYERRHLYEVILNLKSNDDKEEESKPIIVIEAGQQAGTEPVMLALYVIEQLVACFDNNAMLRKVKWVILPCTNPDGQEYARFNRKTWKKNLKLSEDGLSFGVDISRNFDAQWGSCERIDSSFSLIFPGTGPSSENETVFIKNVLTKYKKDIKVYLSLRRDGHSILYPYAYTRNNPPTGARIARIAADVVAKVNPRAGGLHAFINDSIFNLNGKPHCGHSVDYAYDLGIPLSYEMRVFLGSDSHIMSKFQTLPRGYETSLRNGYFSGIRELYNAVANDKKFSKKFK